MLKCLLPFFACTVLFSLTLAGQDASTSKSATKPQASKKTNETYSATAAKTQYMRETGYRDGRPGYVVVYRKPLRCGGTEDTSNLEWLTLAEAKAKEKTERKGCK